MKSKAEILADKELQLARLKKEVEALRVVAPLLAEESEFSAKFPAETTRTPGLMEDKIA